MRASFAVGLFVLANGAFGYPSYTQPSPQSAFFVAYDFGNDGRAFTYDGFEVWQQDVALGSSFTSIGTAGILGGADPAFLEVSPDGTFMAIGVGVGGFTPSQNGKIYVLPVTGGVATLAGDIDGNFDAAFRSDSEVFVSHGSFGNPGQLSLLNLNTSAVTLIVDAIPGSSAGVAVAPNGDLLTGVGYAPAGPNTPDRTGEIRRFLKADVDSAISSLAPLDWTADGIFVADILGAGQLEFDVNGDLYVGGADLYGGSGDNDYLALIDPDTGLVIQTWDPDPTAGSSYNVAYNDALQIWAAFNGAYGADYTIVYYLPEPAASCLLSLGGASWLWRRRRRRSRRLCLRGRFGAP